MRCLQDFAVKERLGASQVTAIGALSSAKIAFLRLGVKTIPAYSRRGTGRKSLPWSAISRWAPTGNRAFMCMLCLDAATARPLRAPAGRSREADARDHHHEVTGASLQGEGYGERASADQRAQITGSSGSSTMKIAVIQGPGAPFKVHQKMSGARGRTALGNLRRGGKLSDRGRTGGRFVRGAGITACEKLRSLGARSLWKSNLAWPWPRPGVSSRVVFTHAIAGRLNLEHRVAAHVDL